MTIQKHTAFDTKVKQKGSTELRADLIPESLLGYGSTESVCIGFTNHHKTDLLTHEHTKPRTIETPIVQMDMDIAWK